MTPEPVCVEPTTSLVDLARTLAENEISGAPVVDRQGRVAGVVSKTDLIRCCMEGSGQGAPAYMFESLGEHGDGDIGEDIPAEDAVCVEDFMSGEPETVRPEASIADVGRLMVASRIHRVIVVDEEMFPVGIITTLDLLGRLLREIEGQ
jgi:CBS domain-containing protein